MTKISVVNMFSFPRVHLSWTICQVSFNASDSGGSGTVDGGPKGSLHDQEAESFYNSL